MNKKVLSFALSTVLALATPATVLAAPGSPANTGSATSAVTSTGVALAITSDANAVDANTAALVVTGSSVSGSEIAKAAAAVVKDAADYTTASVYDVEPNALAKAALANGYVDVTFKDSTIKETDDIVVVHIKDDGTYEVAPSVKWDNGYVVVRISGNSFSPFAILRKPGKAAVKTTTATTSAAAQTTTAAAASVTAVSGQKAVPNTADR